MNCGTTHHEGCPCHEAAEVEGLREQVDINEERYAAWRRRWEEMREIAAENKAEIDRLRDGIRKVADDLASGGDPTALRLRALLDDNHTSTRTENRC